MKKLFISVIIVVSIFFFNIMPITVSASLDPSCYSEEGKIYTFSTWDRIDNVFNAEIWHIDNIIPKIAVYGVDSKKVDGTVTYPNYNDMKLGNFDLQWVFTPSQDRYESKSGIFHLFLIKEDSYDKNIGGIIDEIVSVEDTTTSLTATSLSLADNTTYAININNKVDGVTYSFISSNESIASVNQKSGIVKAKKHGKATITCKGSDGNKFTTSVIVGVNEDMPTLSETELSLSIGDKFDIDVYNKVKGSKVKFTSSNTKIVKVKSSNGITTAIGNGEAVITCTITNGTNVVVLRCDVEVSD